MACECISVVVKILALSSVALFYEIAPDKWCWLKSTTDQFDPWIIHFVCSGQQKREIYLSYPFVSLQTGFQKTGRFFFALGTFYPLFGKIDFLFVPLTHVTKVNDALSHGVGCLCMFLILNVWGKKKRCLPQ